MFRSKCLVCQAALAARLLVSVLPTERDGEPDFESRRRRLAMKGGQSAGSSSSTCHCTGTAWRGRAVRLGESRVGLGLFSLLSRCCCCRPASEPHKVCWAICAPWPLLSCLCGISLTVALTERPSAYAQESLP